MASRSAAEVAAGFSITGLLDGAAKTRERFPVAEIPVSDIADHPANVAYSMDDYSIRQLAESISKDGLTDLPLVRKLPDGGWQMISGHRRKAAYALLAEGDPAFSKLPCRVIEGIGDEQAVTLLHTANYFVRQLTVTERAAATQALGAQAEILRREAPEFQGARLADVKAAIIERQTGRKVSGKTIQREERAARRIAEKLIPEWSAPADAGNLTAAAIDELCGMDAAEQRKLFAAMPECCTSKRDMSAFVRSRGRDASKPDARLDRALRSLRSYLASPPKGASRADLEALREIASLTTSYGLSEVEPVERRKRACSRQSSK